MMAILHTHSYLATGSVPVFNINFLAFHPFFNLRLKKSAGERGAKYLQLTTDRIIAKEREFSRRTNYQKMKGASAAVL